MAEKIEIIISGDARQLISSLKQAGVSVKDFAKETGEAEKGNKGFGLSVGQVVTAVAGFSLVQNAAGMLKEFGAASLEAARSQKDAANALTQLLGSTEAYQQAMGQIKAATNGTISETEAARAAFGLLDNGIAKSATEAAKYVQAGKALNAALGETASFEKFLMLLDEGSDMLLNNFNITGSMVQARQQEIMATEGLSEKEARLAAVRQLALEKGLALAGSISEETVAAQQASAAFADFQAAFGGLLVQLDQATGLTGLVTSGLQQMTAGAKAYAYVFREALPAIEAHNQASDQAVGKGLALAKSLDEVKQALSGTIHDYDQVRAGLVASTDSVEEYNAVLDKLARMEEENRAGLGSLIATLAMGADEYQQLKGAATEAAAAIQQQAAAQQEAVMLQQAAANMAYLQTEAQRGQNAEMERWAGLAETNKQQLDALAQGHTLTAEQAKAYAEAQREAAAAEQQRQEMMQGLLSGMADYYNSIGELQQGQADREAAFQGQLASIREEAASRQAEAAASLTETLAQLEQERQDKIQWVLSGAHARTQQENDEALGYWNAHYDQLKNEAIAKNQEITAGIETEYQKRENAAAAARAREQAEYEAHLNELKLKTAMSLLETTGQLEQLTGLVGLKAGEAVELINAGVLPVTQEMGLAIQETLAGLQSQDSAVAMTAQENQALLKEAYEGTLSSLEAQNTLLGNHLPESLAATQLAGQEMTGEMQTGLANVQTATHDADKRFQAIYTTTLPALQKGHGATAAQMKSDMAGWQAAGVAAGNAISAAVKRANSRMQDFSESTKEAIGHLREFLSLLNSLKAQGGGGADKAQDNANALGNKVNFASGTPAGGFVVPPGYPNDSFMVGLTSGERVFVQPAGERMKAEGGRMNLQPSGNTGGQGGNTLLIQNVNLFEVQDPSRFFEALQREAKARGLQFAMVN